MTDRFRNPTPDSSLSALTDTSTINAIEAAAYLGVNERTIRRAIIRGDIVATRHSGVYRISLTDLIRYQYKTRQERTSPSSSYPVPPILVPLPAFHQPLSARLPRPLTTLIGRDAEVAHLSQTITRTDIQIVTLIGPGGVGKTRLALEVAGTTDSFHDGTYFVRLAPIRQPELVASEIARAVGVQGSRRYSLVHRLASVLEDRQVLLILDNFEHLLDAASLVSDLITYLPKLTVLVTSRSPLRISGEHVLTVHPLALESPNNSDLKDSAVSAAVQLFVERANTVQNAFVLTDSNAGMLEAICRRLDGLPLAIELAAVHIRAVQPSELLAHMERSLPHLTGGSRNLPLRQQTMRDAIAWSYDLLRGQERALFRRLSVFMGGIPLSAALIASAELAGNSIDALGPIEALIDASLLRQVGNSESGSRYAMLETIREYGHELLASHGEVRSARDAHAAYVLQLGQWLDPNMLERGELLDDRLLQIQTERPNLVAALTHLDDIGNAEGLLDLAGRCSIFWHHLGYLLEGRAWLQRALHIAPMTASESNARALAGMSLLCWTQGDYVEARTAGDNALAMAIALNHTELTALSRHLVALVMNADGDFAGACEYMTKALDLWSELGLPTDEAMARMVLSEIYLGLGDFFLSRQYANDALEIFRRHGHRSGIASALVRLSRVAMREGDERFALEAIVEALRQWSVIGERWGIPLALVELAQIALRHGQTPAAATLLGAIDIRIEEAGMVKVRGADQQLDQMVESAASEFGLEPFEAARRIGRDLSIQDLVSVACGITILPKVPEPRKSKRALLTDRELDVLALVVKGQSNRVIAASLFVSERTIENHVGRILAKLGVPSRTAAATRSLELGLLRLPDSSG